MSRMSVLPSDSNLAVFFLLLCCSCCAPSLAQTNFSGSAFACPRLSSTGGTPTTVHQLRPSDIRVVGAMGNSLTAGFGVLHNITQISVNPTDFRGLSFSGGGDLSLPYVTTLPNIIRQYNPDLYGYATATTPIVNFIDLPNNRLNVAQTGAQASEMLSQAQNLVRKMRESDQVDFDNDWKIVTFFIGSNDLCQLPCINDPLGEPDNWIQSVTRALDYLQENLPRAFVNVIQLPHYGDNMREAVRNTTFGPTCAFFFGLICNCSTFGENSIGDRFDEILLEYRKNLGDLIDSSRYDVSDNFTVVLQPFPTRWVFEEIDGEPDLSLLGADCSHLSPSGNRDMAIALWNNMFERVGEKSSTLRIGDMKMICPTDEEPFIFTSKNSGSPHFSDHLYSVLVTAIMMLMIS